MSFWRVILSVIFPPLSVWDRGCGSILIVFILTLFGWVPGVIAALVILNNVNDKKYYSTKTDPANMLANHPDKAVTTGLSEFLIA